MRSKGIKSTSRVSLGSGNSLRDKLGTRTAAAVVVASRAPTPATTGPIVLGVTIIAATSTDICFAFGFDDAGSAAHELLSREKHVVKMGLFEALDHRVYAASDPDNNPRDGAKPSCSPKEP